MAKRKDIVSEQLQQLADDLEELWRAATRDPKVEKRKERGWTILAGVLGAASTMASRRLVTKLWTILTDEQPPTARPAQPAPKAQSHEREDVAAPTR
jgi:hypothetical protein